MIKEASRKLSDFISKIENLNISFLLIFLYIFSMIMIRGILESFSSLRNSFFIFPGIMFFFHYMGWYLVAITLFAIVLNLFTKEKILKIFKVISVFMPIILIAPIIDLIFTGGAKIGYVNISSLHDILYNSFGWLWMNHVPTYLNGVTYGLIAEILLLSLLLLVYVFIKTKSVVKTITSFLVFYLIGFFLGSFPTLIPTVFTIIGLKNWGVQAAFLSSYSGINVDVGTSVFLFFIMVILLPVLFFIYDQKKFSYFFTYLSKTRVIHYLLMLNFGIVLAVMLNLNKIQWSYLTVIVIILANVIGIFSWSLSKLINDYYDKKEDSVNNHNNPFINNKLNKKEIKLIYSVIFAFVLLCSSLLGYAFFFLVLLMLGIAAIYSCPPLRLKRIVFLSHLCIGAVSGLVFLSGFLLVSGNVPPPESVIIIFVLIILAFFLGSHVKDIKDYNGDKKAGILTLPTLLGEKKSRLIISVMISLAFFVSIIILRLVNLIPLAILFSVVILYLLNRKKYSEMLVFASYFIFFIIIVVNLVLLSIK